MSRAWAASKHCDAKDAGLLGTLQGDGLLSMCRLHKAGLADSDECPWCGEAGHCLRHLALECKHCLLYTSPSPRD
eukprot:7966592-Alexandrium_andersonii.AAC.1